MSALLVAAPPEARAHDLERTQVSIAFTSDGSFVLDVANDPDWLLQRLEPFAEESGLPPRPQAGRPSDSERDARLAELAPAFIDRVVLFVDGHEVRSASAEYVAPALRARIDDLAAPGIYRLRARLPPDARTLRWYYGLVIDRYPLTIHRADGHTITEWIAEDAWSGTLDLSGQFHAPTGLDVAHQYIVVGYTHVLPKGADHILFVLGVLLLSGRTRLLLTQVAAFILADVTTLVLTMAGIALPASRVIDPAMALLIAAVAMGNVLTQKLRAWRVAAVFAFGLMHGMRFAGVLRGLGLPRGEQLIALSAFNLGVEAGQLTVLTLAVLCVAGYQNQPWYRRTIVVPASIAIAATGVYWAIVRGVRL